MVINSYYFKQYQNNSYNIIIFFKVFDEKYLKPFFIAEYVSRKQEIHTERLIKGREKYRVELNVCDERENFQLPLTIKEEYFVIVSDEEGNENDISINSPEASTPLSKLKESKDLGLQRLTVSQKLPQEFSEKIFSMNTQEEKDIFNVIKREKTGNAQDDSA